MESLPLFPLGTVLLPGAPLPLHIFEPRYVAMMTHVLRLDEPEFGVVAIRRGSEVGSTRPTLHPVGCSAVVEVTRRSEEHMQMETRGYRRFRIDAVHEDRAPYLVADVTWLDTGQEEVALDDEVDRATRAFTAFVAGVDGRVDGLPDDPRLLTASILDGLGLPRVEQQRVLEAGDTAARLDAVTRLCRREQALAQVLGCRAATVTPSDRLSPN